MKNWGFPQQIVNKQSRLFRCGGAAEREALARSADGFASFKCYALPSCARLTKKPLKSHNRPERWMPAGVFKTELLFTWPLSGMGTIKRIGVESKTQLQIEFFFDSSMFGKSMVNNLWCVEALVSAQAHVFALATLTGNPPFFWSPLSSWWGSEVGINCTSKRLLMPAEITGCCFCINIKIHSTVRESSFESISIHNALTHKDRTVGNLDSGSSLIIYLASSLCSYMHFRQPYIRLYIFLQFL